MTSVKSATSNVRFEPVLAAKPEAPGHWMLVLGVIYPAVVIAIELATRMCAESLFDPMPTYWHTLAISLVPAGNLLLWSRIPDGAEGNPAWLAFANGAVMAIAGFYALLFLPLLPIALVGTLIGIGLLPLAPLASFACALKLRSGFRRGHRERASWSLLGGVAAGLVLLLALDL